MADESRIGTNAGGSTMAPADITLEKTLPNSLESERAVLGAILVDEKAIFVATEALTAEADSSSHTPRPGSITGNGRVMFSPICLTGLCGTSSSAKPGRRNRERKTNCEMADGSCRVYVPQKPAMARYLRILVRWKRTPEQWEDLADRAVMRFTRKFPMPGELHEIASEITHEAQLAANSKHLDRMRLEWERDDGGID